MAGLAAVPLAAFFVARFLAAFFFAFFFAAFRTGLPPSGLAANRAARASSRFTASSIVNVSGDIPLRSEALSSPSVTYGLDD